MTLTLRIDNLDTLPDGGPLQYRSVGRGVTIGRGETQDWTLPDPSRFISGKHCEIRYEDEGYWLSDVSTNGTFLNGSRQRMKSPHRLTDGERIGIGHYVVAVSVEAAASRPSERSDPYDAFGGFEGQAPLPAPADDIWGSSAPAPAPIDRRDLMPARLRGQRAADFSQEFLGFPAMRPATEDPFGAAPVVPVPAPPSQAELSASRPVVRDVAASPSAGGRGGQSFFSDPRAGERPEDASPARQPAATPQIGYPGSTAGGDAQFLRRFAVGAGIDPFVFADCDPADTAEEIGRVMRVVIEDVQQLLKARQAAKVLARSSKRTMLGRINNPLKFLPSPEEVLEVLFTGRRSGYLAAVEAFEEAFGDLKRHEMATYAAMQSALSRLLSDLAPEAIEDKVTGSAFSSRKSRNWEMYVTRWEAKTEPYENGMLDVFLAYFAEAYDEGQPSR